LSSNDRERKEGFVPDQRTLERARRDKRAGKAPSSQAGEFVKEEMDHIREGKHGARSAKQAIAIGLSKARRAGVKLPPPKAGRSSEQTRRQAARDLRKGSSTRRKTSSTRSRATTKALKRESRSAASHQALARQAKHSARRRSVADRSRQAKKAAGTRRANR
jgi:hypothetical protein